MIPKKNDGKKYVLRYSLRIILYLISKLLTVGQGQIYLFISGFISFICDKRPYF